MRTPDPGTSLLRRHFCGVLWLALVPPAVGCAGPDAAAAGASVLTRDSAGVTIVEIDAAGTDRLFWSLDSQPLASIGVAFGELEHELSDVRGAVRLSDGRLVVANNGTREVRYYSADGRHLHTEGRDGGGPGEFRTVSWLSRLPGDSVAVYDTRERRLSILDDRGTYTREIPYARSDRFFFPSFLGRLGDGTYAAQIRFRNTGADIPLGLGRDSMQVVRLGSDGSVADTIGMFADRIVEVQMRDILDTRRRIPGTLPFTPRTVAAANAQGVVVGVTDRIDLRWYAGGALRTIVRSNLTGIPITERHRDYIVDSLRTQWAGRLDNPEINLMIRITETSPLPEFFPLYDSVAVDTEGNMWLAAYRQPGDSTTSWTVYRANGAGIVTVRGPDRFRATEFGADYVLGVTIDGTGIQRVEIYRLNKSQE